MDVGVADVVVRIVLGLIATALVGGGGLGAYRLLRLQRRDADDAVSTSQRINEAYGGLLKATNDELARVRTLLEECEDDRADLRRGGAS